MNTAFVACFFGGLVLVCWSLWFSLRESAREQATTTATQSLVAEFRAAFNQEQLEMCGQMAKAYHASQFAEAVVLVDKLLPIIADHNSQGYFTLLLMKLEGLLKQNHVKQAESLCLDYIQQNVSWEQKVKMLDGLASYILYQSAPAFLTQAERFARMGLEMAPGTLTLKGTLGSVLVEQGNYAEGELLLHDCLHSSKALHDRAISSFYLGVIKLRNGDAKAGKRLMKRAMKMFPEAWMIAKGTALLKD